jgi:transposase
MNYRMFVGIDWANENHQVCVVDAQGNKKAEFSVEHSAAGMDQLAHRLLQLVEQPEQCAVAIELNRGPIVEGLLERGFHVFGINPKQVDRFRDRHGPAGAKDDRRDAYVLADALRGDRHRFRRLELGEPLIIQLRELSRTHDELRGDLRRLTNRLREQLHRYFPQLLKLCSAADEPWLWALLLKAPTPHRARRLRKAQLAKLLRDHRIRRFSATELHSVLAQPALHLAPGSVEAASEHVSSLLLRLKLTHEQLRETDRRLGDVYKELCESDASQDGRSEHRDAEILLSLPGVGKLNGAAMLSEASQALRDRDYYTMRSLSGVAPVTRQSGTKRLVLMRRACNHRLRDALYTWAESSSQHDDSSQAFYRACRARGLKHPQAIRCLGDRLLRILFAMLRDRTLYDPLRHSPHQAA